MTNNVVKTLAWIGSSRKDLSNFPDAVRKEMGHALFLAQKGEKARNAKPLKGFRGISLMEIVVDDGTGTYRTMYTARFDEIIYVLHAFQKKSKTGIKTDRQDIELIEARLKWAEQKHKEWLAKNK